MNKHLLTFLAILLSYFGIAQGYYPPIINYTSKEYKINKLNDDGTPYTIGPENYAIIQDDRGVMYFGNSNGILEYDGQNWDFIEVQFGSYVTSLAIDSFGTIYAGATNNFGYLKIEKNNKLIFHSLLNELKEENQMFSDISNIFTSKTKVYFQAREVFFEYDIKSKQIIAVPAKNSYHRSFIVNSNFYVRQRGVGLQKWSNNKLITLKGTEYLFGKFEQTGYGCFGMHQSLFSDSLVIITQEQGIFKYLNDSLVPVLNPDKNPINDLKLFNSIRLSDGNFAVNTFINGVYIINEKGQIKRSINQTTGLRTNDVKCMFEDKDQNLWLGLGNGISKINYYSPLSYFNEKSGINGNIEAFIRYNGLLYVGSSFGLYVQNNSEKKAKEFLSFQSITDQVWDFKIINNKLYIATSEGIWELNTNTDYKKISTINTHKIYASYKQIITAGQTSIDIWSNRFTPILKIDVPLNTVLSIEQDPNQKEMIWIGTAGSGAYRVNTRNNYEITQYGEFEGLYADNMAKPIIFKNNLVFGCGRGLLKFMTEEEVKATLPAEFQNDPENYGGMFDIKPFYDSLFKAELLLIQEANGKTWFTADQKIGYYDLETKTFTNKPFWGINYGRVNKFYLEQNEVLWIGCADGLIRYKKNNQKNYKSKFNSLIRQVTIGEDSIIFFGAQHQFKTEKVVINYNLNDIKFRFAAPYFEDEHIPLYAFILEGKNKKWSDWTTDNTANYTNLPYGNYTFKVKAQNIYGTISTIANYNFTISPPWYNTIWAYVGYFLLSLLIIYAVIKISSKRLKTKNEWLEGVVEERTKEISEKNDVLEHKNTEISEQKREIEDSINYAKRIQTAILPLDEEMKLSLPKSFVLFKPKDIVSGDFYWYTKHKNKLVIVCADCTGHGVPGAFMSMIGSDRLNIIVNERHQTSPGKILSELNRAIKKTLKQGDNKDSTKDGMDASICTVDLDTNTMIYAGAYRPLWIVENDKLTEIKATKVAVAGFTPENQIYDEHTIQLKKGMKFYMTSDGYADQFGGVKGKKYKVKTLKNYILTICNLDFNEQSKKLDYEIIRWMNEYEDTCEQVDDICVIGFEV